MELKYFLHFKLVLVIKNANKPFNAQSETYRKFLTQIVLKIERLKEKFPYFDLQKELEQCQARLKI